MRLQEQLSDESTFLLLAFLEDHLVGCPREFQEDVKHAIRLAAPRRERTHLVRLAANIVGVEWQKVVPIALAAELLMISALTSDDVVDGSRFRSGEPTLFHRKGTTCAFFVAEWLHTVAYSALFQESIDILDLKNHEVTKEFRLTSSKLFLNQYLESSLEGNNEVSLDRIDALAYGRTGRLLQVCLEAPAILKGDVSLRSALAECGRWFGIAFQHRDDVLDFIADPEVLGKPVLLDLLNGQPNLVLFHLFTQDPACGLGGSTGVLHGAAQKDPGVLARGFDFQPEVLSNLRASGSLEFARSLVFDYCNRAIEALSHLPSSAAKVDLIGIINLVSRIEFPWEETS